VNELRRKIEQEILQRGPIPFSHYMEFCLYDDEYGYYSRNAAQFGKAGDFYTASDVHAVFGRLMARQFEEIWRVLGSPERVNIKELGPGRGLFAQDVLDWSENKFPDFFRALRYVLAERSLALRERIAQTLARHIQSGKAIFLDQSSGLKSIGKGTTFTESAETLAPREIGKGTTSTESAETLAPREIGKGTTFTESAETLAPREIGKGTTSVVPQGGTHAAALAAEVPTIIFANEFFDALPVEIVSTLGSLRIKIDARNGRFLETWVPTSAEELEFLDRYSVHPQNADPQSEDRIEVLLAAQASAGEILRDIAQGFFVAIDYGYTRAEQLAGRHRGTLKAIRQHSASANPYEAPGEQDITADVNFTALAAAAEQLGWNVQKLITQSQFLMGIGEVNQFADAFEDCRLPQERAKVALQLKHLVTPAGMGESFHVLVASKGIEGEKVSELAGLNFGQR
jgi:SAM-dependent MidA family methyltransferase